MTRSVGRGTITYIGATLDPSLMTAITAHLMSLAKVDRPWPDLPPDIDIGIRENNVRRVVILTNFGKTPRHLVLPEPMQDILTGKSTRTITLPQYTPTFLQRSR